LPQENDDVSDQKAIFRRLFFSTSPHMIQTEARMVLVGSAASKPKKKKKKGKNKSKDAKTGAATILDTELASHSQLPPATLEFDYSHLCFDHHRSMLAGLVLVPKVLSSASANVFVVGLGGTCPLNCAWTCKLRLYFVHVRSQMFALC
jgi:hypothetical protein